MKKQEIGTFYEMENFPDSLRITYTVNCLFSGLLLHHEGPSAD